MMKRLLFIIPLLVLLMAGSAFAANISNGDIDDEDMADITDWADADTGTGDSSQATFDGKSCMKLDTGATEGGLARREQDIGTCGARTVFSFNFYFDFIGTLAQEDYFSFKINDGATSMVASFCSDGLFIRSDAGGFTEVGTDLVSLDVWQEWTFDVDWTAKTVDVYLGQILQASDVNCNRAEAETDGTVTLIQRGYISANRITYIDWFKAGSDFAPTPPAISGQVIWW